MWTESWQLCGFYSRCSQVSNNICDLLNVRSLTQVAAFSLLGVILPELQLSNLQWGSGNWLGAQSQVALLLCTSQTHAFGHSRLILIKEETWEWRKMLGGCGRTYVATVTAVSKGLALEGIRLEKRSRKTTFCAFKCFLTLSLLIPCHTQLPLQWGEGGREGMWRDMGEDLAQRVKAEIAEDSYVCLNLSEGCCTCACRGKHPRLSSHI